MLVDWQALLSHLGSTAIIAGALAYIGKKVIELWLSQRLQLHKQSLDTAAQQAIETLRSELRISEARQSRLLERQARIVAGAFARLEQLHEALTRLAAPIHHGEAGAASLRDVANEKFNGFARYYHERAIWLDVGTCTRLNELVALLATLLTKLNYNLLPNGQIADRTRWIETYKRLEEEVPKARKALDQQFRRILGVAMDGEG